MMKGMTSKLKIIILAVVFVLFAAGMYIFGYGVMANRNQLLADSIAKSNVELEVLQREQKSFEQGKKDLAILEKSQYPPDDLFSRDTKVVKEIQQLEAAAQKYGLELKIDVSGSVKAALPAKGTVSELFAIPYTITLDGSAESMLLFMQALERMPFVTHANTFSISVTNTEAATGKITSEFYIRK